MRHLFQPLEPRRLFAATPVGVNLDALTDESAAYVFVDAMKSARAFGSAAAPWDTAAPVDANGWPTQDAGACVITLPVQYSPVQQLPHIDGTYHFSATGNVTVAGVASDLSIANRLYNAATNTTTADVIVAPGAANLYLSFTGVAGGVKNIKLIRPGYAADTTQIFTNEFLTALAPVQTLRLMEFLRTNNNAVANWSDRAQITDAEQSTTKGVAWEYAIDLANTTHKDLWINIPGGATDDYVTQLARLMKTRLDPSLHVYLEYSNEVWNYSYSQAGINSDAAQSEVAANPDGLNYDHADNTYYFAWRHIGERLVQITRDFTNVYGQSALNTTLRPVLASQIGWSFVLRDQLAYLQHTFGNPSQYLYAVAGAPYVNLGDASYSPTLTTDQVLSTLQQNIAVNQTGIAQYASLAAFYGLKNMIYEGGVELTYDINGNFANAKVPANYDPRMATIVRAYLTAAAADGVDQVMYYTLAGAFSPSGTWGLTENLGNLNSPKYAGLAAFANADRPATTTGFMLNGGSVSAPGAAYIGDTWETAGTGTGDLSSGSPNPFDYLLNVYSPDTYSFTLTTAAPYAGATVTVLLDNATLTTLALPATGSPTRYADTASISLGNLTAGLHTLRLQFNSGGFALHSINFTSNAIPTIPVLFPWDISPAAPATPGASAATQTSLTPNDTVTKSKTPGPGTASPTLSAPPPLPPSRGKPHAKAPRRATRRTGLRDTHCLKLLTDHPTLGAAGFEPA